MLLPIKAFSYMFKFRFRSLAIFFFLIELWAQYCWNIWIHTLSELSTPNEFAKLDWRTENFSAA